MPHRNKAIFFMVIMVLQLLAPIPGYALSGGNKAPEFESFQPLGLDNMVDPSTGDFSYNIPLMNVGFHGINLFYQAGITMDQEATMLGLGWNINSGVINRTVRGIPDDFRGDGDNGDIVNKKMHTKPYTTIGFKPGVALEFFGLNASGNSTGNSIGLSANLGIYSNSHDGIGFEYGVSPSVSSANFGAGKLTAGFGLSGSSDGGASLSANISYNTKYDKIKKVTTGSNFAIGGSINSRGGLKGISLSSNLKTSEKNKIVDPSFSGFLSFAKPSFVPSIDFPRKSNSFSINGAVGTAISASYPSFTVQGYYSQQKIEKENVDVKAFGLLYQELATEDGMQDFNRAKDIPQSEDVPNLAVPNLTYDIFGVSGPGLSGSLRLKRGDLGIVSDRVSQTSANDIGLGLEIGPGTLIHVGGDIVGNFTREKVRFWEEGNNLLNTLNFKGPSLDDPSFEKAILKKSDDASIELNNPNSLFSQIHELDPICPELTSSGGLQYDLNGNVSIPNNPQPHNLGTQTGKRNQRVKRSNNVIYRTFEEARIFGFSKYINQFISPYAKDHHIAEILVENEDGNKYIYGLPVYNISQVEETFAITTDESTTYNYAQSKNSGLVNFNSTDRSVGNKNGKDEFYSSTSLPPFVSSYLLTAIVSSDYQDLTNDGPSPDDFGSYVRFEYEQGEDYNWKTPTSDPNTPPPPNKSKAQASYSIGFISNHNDDKAHLVYGKREQYFPDKIFSKTEVAVYNYREENRKDAQEETITGDFNPTATKPLNSIVKYSLVDYNANVNNIENAKPLKSAHFEFDYSLCKGVYNGTDGDGKLTLKKVFILNGTSTKGRFSPYVFDYGFNPNYNPKAVNRYGTFQPREIDESSDSDVSADDLSTIEFPYVPQNNREYQNHFASAWNLNKISLPSGGEIYVNYEADDYAYVQDKRAMQMVEIHGFSKDLTSDISEKLYDNSINHNFLYFKIEDPDILEKINANPASADDIVKDHYIGDISTNLLYYKVLGRLKPEGSFQSTVISQDPVHEFVPGWARITSNTGVRYIGNNPVGYVELKPVCLKERKLWTCSNKINPISKTLMQALRLNLPEYLYGTSSFDDEQDADGILNTVLALTSLLTQLTQLFTGVNTYMKSKNFGNEVVLERSFIRLYAPSYKKVSGSHRVKSIIMNDRFHNMTNGVHSNGIYGKQYEYNTDIQTSQGNLTISSGVAAYEPMIGGEENPFFMAIPYKEELLCAPDNQKYQEEPMLENYFPAPRIIYSKVTTRDIFNPSGNVTIDANTEMIDIQDLSVYHKTGFIENHFYTYKDYPIITKQTEKKFGDPYKTPKVFEFLSINSKDFYTATQGYSILDPLMHGTAKATYNFNAAGQRISGQEFLYKEKPNGELSYDVDALVKNANNFSIESARLGLDYDMFADVREYFSKFNTYGMSGNVDIPTPLPAPIPFPSLWPKYADVQKRFRSLVLVKSAKQNGILEKTVSINGSAEIVTQHLLWDAETGQPIVSKTTNEFEDPIYTVNLPAHLAYDQMGLSYQNTSGIFSSVSAVNGIVNASTPLFNAVTEGDLLYIRNIGSPAWVLKKENNQLALIDENGYPISFSNSQVEIIESGFTNQGSESVASYITKDNPILGNQLVIDASKKVIDANAVTFKDKWQTFCYDQKIYSANNSILNDLIVDGGFESGVQQFDSDYQFTNGNIGPGKVRIVEDSQDANPPWASCTTPELNGKMLVVDCSTIPNEKIWCQTFNVVPNRYYDIRLNIININPTDPATISYAINDELITDNFELDSETCDWTGFFHYWSSGANTQIEFCLKNFSNNASGNDFAIDNISFKYSSSLNNNSCGPAQGDVVNPFLKNIKGNWRPHQSYVFQTDRSANDNIREDGHYTTLTDNYNNEFYNFWQQGLNQLIPQSDKWTWTSENTMVSPIGNELEARDPLYRYSAELVGYNQQKVVAVAGNARYNEIAYYGAEIPLENGADVYGLSPRGSTSYSPKCPLPYHFNLVDGERVYYQTHLPNSGDYSIKYTGRNNTVLEFDIRPPKFEECPEQNEAVYTLEDCDCIPIFEPHQGGKYLVSAWLHNPCLQDDGCDLPPKLQVFIDGSPTVLEDHGPLIEGWRKVEGVVTIAPGAQQGEIQITYSGEGTYLDDIRIHPFNASMKTYNYDLKTLRFTFEHDDNNFFTRYDYADDGTLERISKQTEKGIQTLQESTFSQQKNY